MKKYFLNKYFDSYFSLFIEILIFPSLVILFFPHTSTAEIVTYSVNHRFSIDDVQGGFNGKTYAQDSSIICGISDACPAEAQPFSDTSGTILYPVDNEFGFYVADFVGAAQKVRDDDYAEGWVGNIISNGEVIGLKVSNAETDTFKVKAPMGTWCAGLGGNMVKCSTEHFTVLEHIKTCYETIPYKYADPISGDQSPLFDPASGDAIENATCDEGVLDNTLYVVKNGLPSIEELGVDSDGYPNLIPNESSVREDIAVSRDYSITKKDDGKALYRFGSLIKRPNDIRLYARIPLPQEWKDNPGTNYPILRAELHVDHLITNNPNDQIRPEDMENEGATGRLPGYYSYGGVWFSTRDCYEGDGDFIGEGTVFKNPPFAESIGNKETDPVAFSEDLREGFTNAWYTTTDRDPFEDYYVGDNYVSGPRWRLKANKFGQDIPGLELPSVECMPTPYTSQFIKYKAGETTTTVIDLLDFEDENSPLLWSEGWMSPNGVNVIALDKDGNQIRDDEGNLISVNGSPLTEDFDLAVYVKGDKKTTAIYNATLILEYEGEGDGEGPGTPPAEEKVYDLSLDTFKVPRKISGGTTKKFNIYITNYGPDVAEGTLVIEANLASFDIVIDMIAKEVSAIAPGETVKIIVPWEAPYYDNEYVNLTATLNAEGDINPENNTLTGTSFLRMP
ncbi:hypothetical protein [Desulfosediminicola flagellatus]|uniref:COG1470 family protein n=1 Tax=Desulfosediminicola flagellatus TaxID=2569541 RepID=UPI0010ACADD0|nr:hypothetical protein [Desulfosediminicola flagellatus]